MSNPTSQSEILLKIRKLLALANDKNASEGEIENALMFAQKLKIKHAIEDSAIQMSPLDVEETSVDCDWKKGTESKTWTWQLLDIIAGSHNCRVVRSHGWNAETQKPTVFYRIIGFLGDREMVIELFSTVVPMIRNLTQIRYKESNKSISKVKFTISYQAGFMVGLNNKLKADFKETLKLEADNNKYQLIVVKKDALISNYIKENMKVKNTSRAKTNHDVNAFLKGRADGSQSTTVKQLNR